MTETATNNPPTHTTRLAPLDVIKWSGVPPRMTFPVNGRPPPLQYEYQSIILCVHFDALQLMFGFPCFSITDSPWPTERRGIVPTSICICVLVCQYLPFYVCICLNITEYRKKFLIEKDKQRGALSSFKSGRVLAAAASSRCGFSFATTHHQLQFKANWRGHHWSFWFLAGIS